MKHPVQTALAAAFVLCCVSLSLFSQDRPSFGGGNPPKPPIASEIIAQMKKTLSLTDTQVQQITPVITSEVSQMNAVMEQERSGSLDRESVRSKIDAIHAATEKKLSSYLTSDQLKLWKSRKGPGQRQSDDCPPGPEE